MPSYADRHPSTQHVMQYFECGHLADWLQPVSRPFFDLANGLLRQVSDGPELTAALRKLLEAKDCAVRARLADPA